MRPDLEDGDGAEQDDDGDRGDQRRQPHVVQRVIDLRPDHEAFLRLRVKGICRLERSEGAGTRILPIVLATGFLPGFAAGPPCRDGRGTVPLSWTEAGPPAGVGLRCGPLARGRGQDHAAARDQPAAHPSVRAAALRWCQSTSLPGRMTARLLNRIGTIMGLPPRGPAMLRRRGSYSLPLSCGNRKFSAMQHGGGREVDRLRDN